jgi:diadenosine tetraphosphatase ApaH/serine/threonine PP2A family protein phosphatase
MRYLILSDIHGNLDALDAVLERASGFAYDRTLVLGDLVGYGAEPNAVVDRILGLNPFAIIRGNHDKVACGLEDSDGFNPVAQQAVAWTYYTLTGPNREYLASLPIGPIFVDADLEICHGSPDDEDAYITSEIAALRALRFAERPVCLYGHTHVPLVFRLVQDDFEMVVHAQDEETQVLIEPGYKYLVNPGSVGQPRDGDARAAFAVFDNQTRHVTIYRVNYPVELAQQRILEAGLPQALARRLALGR